MALKPWAKASKKLIGNGLLDPRNNLVQHLAERGHGLEAQESTCLVDVGHPALHIMSKGCVVD
jgi:hypothetical protein